MAIVLRISTNKRELDVTVNPGVKAIIVKGELNLEKFRTDNKLGEENKKIPSQVTAVDVATGKEITQLEADEGAPVCYWVGQTLVCW